MANKMRKLLAALIVLCMCFSTVAKPAFAAEVPANIDTTAGTVEGTETVTESTTDNTDGTTTTTTTTVVETPAGGISTSSGDTTINVEFKETVTTTTISDSEGNPVFESGSTEGQETVTTTITGEEEPVVEEVYAGTVEVTFDQDGSIIDAESTTQTPNLPEVPEGAENVQSGEDEISWEENVDGQPAETVGDGTDVDGDGIVDSVIIETDTTTTTTVERTDRELEADLTINEPTKELGDIETGEVEGIGGTDLPEGKEWTEMSAENQAKIEKIQDRLCFDGENAVDAAATQLALDVLLNGGEISEDTDETIRAAAQELIDAANAQEPSASGEPTHAESPAPPEITVTNVSLTVNDKAGNEPENENNDDTDDIYNASVKFDVYVTTDVFGNLSVVVKQGENIIEEKTLEDKDRNENGSYSVNIQNISLQEGVGIDLAIQLDGIQELESNQMYVCSTTVEEPVKVEEQTLGDATSHEGNDKGGNGAMEEAHGKPIVDTSSWSEDSYDRSFSVGQATVTVRAAGKTDDACEIVKIVSDKTIKADYVVIKAADGYIRYPVPGGILIEGVAYTVENMYNETIGKIGGISHVSIYGSGEQTDTPTSESTTVILGTAEESRDVSLGMNMKLDFSVKEAILTTTKNKSEATTVTRTWEDSYEEKQEPRQQDLDPDPDPVDPDPDEPKPGNDPEVVSIEGAEIVTIPDEEVPLAKAPKTGDLSGLWAAISVLSIGGIGLLNRKRKEEENV